MFANKNTSRHSILLILLSVFACATCLHAQEPVATDRTNSSQTPEKEHPAEKRRVERLGDASTDEWEMDLALAGTPPVAAADHGGLELPDEDQNQRLKQLFSSLAVTPEDPEAIAQLNVLLSEVLVQINTMMDEGDLDGAAQSLPVIQSINSELSGLGSARSRLQSMEEATGFLDVGNIALESDRILEPEDDNALYHFKQAMMKDPGNSMARQGLARVQEALVERAMISAEDLDYEMAESWLLEAARVQEDQSLVENAYFEVSALKQQHAAGLERKAIAAMDAGQFTLADFYIIDLIALGEQEVRVETLRVRLVEARFYGGFEPGQSISDKLLKTGGNAPELVIITAGSFLMGSKEHAEDGLDHEKPRHRVTFEHGFALGINEVSVADFRLFIDSTGYQTAAERAGSSSVYDEAAGRLSNRKGVHWIHDYLGRKAEPGLPVLHVNLHDAQAYLTWLSDETGKTYRLPSEAEYEYVARAGGRGTYWWGEGSPAEAVENLTGARDSSTSNRQWTTFFKKYGDGYWGPAPTGSIVSDKLAHPMGVHDIAGNVSEWTQDCWHENYFRAPVDGAAWINPGCGRRVVRGGYWASSPAQCRAAFRISAKAETYGPVVGIRIARDL